MTAVDSATNDEGVARAVWTLGPEAGEQVVEVSAPDAGPITFRATGTPGVVFVAVWRGLDEETRASLPSDTMRIHALSAIRIEPARDSLEAGHELHVLGHIGLGATLDPNWPYHFDPRTVWASTSSAGSVACQWGPLITEEDVEAKLSTGSDCYFPDHLYLERIDPVPDWYLEQLAAG